MATLAALFRRVEADAVPQRRDPGLDPYRLRPMPNEDVFFYSKKIDNSRLVRQPDPRARRQCWNAIGVSSLGAILLMLLLLPNLLGMIAGYQIQALEQERTRLQTQRATLELEEAGLLNPQRLEELARILEFVDPAPGQVLFLNPKAGGELALNAPSR